MKSDETIQTDHRMPPISPAPEIPLTVVLRPNLRFDIPVNVARAARLEHDGLVEIRITAIDLETIIPVPHPFVAKVQHHNFYLTVPRLPAQLLRLQPGQCLSTYIRRVD
jgi:hypothetical protein